MWLQYDSEHAGPWAEPACKFGWHYAASVDEGRSWSSLEAGSHPTGLSADADRWWPLAYSATHCRWQDRIQGRCYSVRYGIYQCFVYLIFLLLMHYVPNVAKRSIWDQCNTEDWPSDRPTKDRPLFLEEPSWKNFKRPYLHNNVIVFVSS